MCIYIVHCIYCICMCVYSIYTIYILYNIIYILLYNTYVHTNSTMSPSKDMSQTRNWTWTYWDEWCLDFVKLLIFSFIPFWLFLSNFELTGWHWPSSWQSLWTPSGQSPSRSVILWGGWDWGGGPSSTAREADAWRVSGEPKSLRKPRASWSLVCDLVTETPSPGLFLLSPVRWAWLPPCYRYRN